MRFQQIIFIVIGVIAIIFSIFSYLHFKSSLVIYKFIREAISESERIKYQKATAKPYLMLGVVFLIIGIFLDNQALIDMIRVASIVVWFVWILLINNKYLGYYFPWSLRK